jgi:hypothetical protein
MSLSIDELSAIYGLNGVNGVTQTNNSTNIPTSEAEKKATDGDSYISTIAGIDADAAIPSDNYNDLARMIKSSSSAGGSTSSTEYASVKESTAQTEDSEETQAAGGAGGAGGGSSDSDSDTETEVVTINGVTYLQTTTTDENGNTTVTRTPIGSAGEDNAQPSAAAEALASM